jgi:bifunctional UDP-N-acetylglucosamine pyrophosphorylase/glucosamine-1-phosphate N-acetyltransferase
MNSVNPKISAVILAAGKGTRMNSDLPKVMHLIAGRPIVEWVVDACRAAGAQRIIVVVGHAGELVRDALGNHDDVEFVEQTEQLGTGHAVDMARPLLEGHPDENVFVLCGDGPLIQAATLNTLLETHTEADAGGTLATAVIPDPSGYGRIVRDSEGKFERIVEQKDATQKELELGEVNPSYYCFKAASLTDALSKVSNDNASGEYYITDVFRIMLDAGERVGVVAAVPPEDILSINTPADLKMVERVLVDRIGSPDASVQEESR